MNKTILTVALASAFASSAMAQTTGSNPLADLSVSGQFAFESEYVFRGKKLAQQSFQPKVEFGYDLYGGSLFAGLWTNQPIGNGGPVPPGGGSPGFETNEVDIYGGYNYELKQYVPGLTLGIGYTYYWYPDVGAFGTPATTHSNEVSFGVSYDTESQIGVNINPSLYFFYDFNLNQNVLEFSLSYDWDLSKMTGVDGISIVPKVYVGWLHANRYQGDGSVLTAPAAPPALTPTIGAWRNSYTYYGFNLDFNYKINSFATFFAGVRVAGNTDGNGAGPTGGIQGLSLNPNAQFWGGVGVKFGL